MLGFATQSAWPYLALSLACSSNCRSSLLLKDELPCLKLLLLKLPGNCTSHVPVSEQVRHHRHASC